ncbi:ABC transporter ATP-binding protein [Thermomonospora umbrina]|uniref:NitT/TauT family transport system ATP-binding protein n=1 Tax=Thermomonospora umbrina TaxID=111806 RepID=A0A3D9SN05_9ACTN|nr:ABC transporter ATP-binding protein [Thermomonospora umbrina]REE95323.1 NitT/TauT family transport system ATP-binding protein [Thermomonospora umbrina]
MTAAIEMRGLRVAFADGLAADVDLEVTAGEIVVLLGPSGCGKSTVLRALAGLLPVAGGTVRPSDGPAHRRGIAMVFQEDALLPWRTARRNVEYALELRGVPRRERGDEALELLEQVGLTGFADHLPGRLSGGMRQRVQLARTLAARPKIMLMDEPFGALDAQTRADMQRLLVSVWERHRTTILFVTHDVDEALLIADRIVLLTPRPATVDRIFEVPRPRAPGTRFEPAFARMRYEILAALGARTERPEPV